jgi:predicted dehydrogenase
VRGSQANSKVTVGLIGSGGRGTYDTGIVNNDPRAKVTALCDLYDDRIEQATERLKLEKPNVYKDYQKLLASDVDAVIIATPPYQHPEQFEAAVQAKKHIYCEKPMGVDVKGVQKVIAASRKADPSKTISVGFQQRYGPVYLEAYKRWKAGEIGTLANARGFWIDRDPFTRRPYADPKEERLRNWFCYRELSGDIIVEQDCHNLDVLHWFLGALPLRAVGMGGRRIRTNMDILDHLTVAYEFPDNLNVNFEANQVSPRFWKKVGEEFTGTEGVLETSRSRMVHVKNEKERDVMESRRDITIDAMEQWVDRIVNGTPENVGERSALSTLIAILGRTAIYKNKEVTWKGEFGGIGV